MPKGIASSRQVIQAHQRVTPRSVGRLIEHDLAVAAAFAAEPVTACTDGQGRTFYRVDCGDYSGRFYVVARRADGSWGCSATNSQVARWAIAKVEAMLAEQERERERLAAEKYAAFLEVSRKVREIESWSYAA